MMMMMMKMIFNDCFYRFTPVQNRSGIRACISEKFVEIFNWYESDLDEVHQIYEAHKVLVINFFIKYNNKSKPTDCKLIIKVKLIWKVFIELFQKS